VKPKFEIGDVLITTGPDERRTGRVFTVIDVQPMEEDEKPYFSGSNYWYVYEGEYSTKARWSENNLRKLTKLDKVLK
jgi:hypothetical protein